MMRGGVKFYRGSPGSARSYIEADRSRADDYYLAEGTGLADRLVATRFDGRTILGHGGSLDGDAYERWVAGLDPTSGEARGRLRTDDRSLRFVEVVVNGPKTWSLAAALHPAIGAAYDAAQDRAAHEIVAWLAEHATTRIGPQGRQIQVPVDALEAVVVRHHTSRAGDPHRHLHLQINARVQVAGRWRGLHSVGVVDSIEAINGIGHTAVATDPTFRAALTRHGYTMDSATGDLLELTSYVGSFSARTRQIIRNTDRFEAAWRTDHPDQEPGPALRRAWDRRAWATARPDKVVPTDGTDLTTRWVEELIELGFKRPTPPTPPALSAAGEPTPADVGAVTASRIDQDKVAGLVLVRLVARRSAWNGADIRGEVERIIAATGLVAEPATRRDLAENLTAHTLTRCVPLLDRTDVPFYIRTLTSPRVQAVEADLVDRLTARAATPARAPAPVPTSGPRSPGSGVQLDEDQQRVVAALAGPARLTVVEGAAGTGKTTTLAAARDALHHQGRRLVVVAPTLKAAEVAGTELGTAALSAMRLIVEHGYRRDSNGKWTREPQAHLPTARLLGGDLLLVDEAGMLDQDSAHALITIADEHHAHLALVGDRHQLPAVGRGGVLDLAHNVLGSDKVLTLDAVHRFTDPAYADLTLLMRTGRRTGHVFDTLYARGEIVIHASESERLAAITTIAADNGTDSKGGTGSLVIAGTRENVATLNAAIRDHRHHTTGHHPTRTVVTSAGERLGAGDLIATRMNNRDLAVANRDRWTITTTHPDGSLNIRPGPGSLCGAGGDRVLPAAYVSEHVELAHATTVHGAQGETADTAHLLLTDTTSAASAYVAMTRGRHHNTAHLVADHVPAAREQWLAPFSRDRADLGPAHATQVAENDIARFGPRRPGEAATGPNGSPHSRPVPPAIGTRPVRTTSHTAAPTSDSRVPGERR